MKTFVAPGKQVSFFGSRCPLGEPIFFFALGLQIISMTLLPFACPGPTLLAYPCRGGTTWKTGLVGANSCSTISRPNANNGHSSRASATACN
jgi:hypothetical protein